jgi:hypothetical protein
MSDDIKIRWGWLKIMYWYTILGAGGFGLAMVVVPETVRSTFGWPVQDPIVYGVTGSVWLAFGLLSILGLKSPLKFVPILLMQLTYKSVWFIGVVLPLLISGKFPNYAILHVVVMGSYIIGDLVAIPFSYVFSKKVFADTALTMEKI